VTLRVVAYIVGSIVAVLAVGTIFSTRFVRYEDEASVLAFGIVLGLLMAFVKPVLERLTLPLTCLTFGAFALVINALLFGVAARVTPGVEASFWGAVAGAIFATVISGIVYSIVDER
jgi:putative membrane protein